PRARPEGDAVEAGLARFVARLTVRADRRVDQPRVERRQILVADAQARAAVERGVGDEDVDVADETMQELLAVRGAQVDRDAALGAVVDDPRIVVGARHIPRAADTID